MRSRGCHGELSCVGLSCDAIDGATARSPARPRGFFFYARGSTQFISFVQHSYVATTGLSLHLLLCTHPPARRWRKELLVGRSVGRHFFSVNASPACAHIHRPCRHANQCHQALIPARPHHDRASILKLRFSSLQRSRCGELRALLVVCDPGWCQFGP